MLELNKEALLEDFWHIGKDLVKKIEVKTDGAFKTLNLFKN